MFRNFSVFTCFRDYTFFYDLIAYSMLRLTSREYGLAFGFGCIRCFAGVECVLDHHLINLLDILPCYWHEILC